MANTYPTSQFPLGSTEVKVLFNNASNLDDAVNDIVNATWTDRFGVVRRTFHGMEQDVQNALLNTGFEFIGDYDADGPLTITRLNQTFSKDGEFWRPGPGLTLPFTTTGSWVSDQPNFVNNGDASLRQALAAIGGSSIVGTPSADGTLSTVADELEIMQSAVMVLDALTDGSDQTSVITAFFQRVKNAKARWHVPRGDYVLNGAAPIEIQSSGICDGRFLIPKANQTCRFDIVRDEPGTSVNPNAWSLISRGMSDVGATNAVGKNLFLLSTEVLIERIGSGGAAYRKQEFIRCPLPGGSFSTPAVCTYNSFANLTVTAYTPSHPITVTGLNVLLTGAAGGVEANRGYITVSRDHVTLNQPVIINADPAQPKPVAIEVSYCADVTINSPHISGFNYAGLGYGILNGTTIGLTVNDADIQDCRHAYTGAFTADVTLNGGSYSRIIDDHWTNRFVANDVRVYTYPGSSAFEFAGYDVTLNRPVASGGRSLFGIRTDTPFMGGRVIINEPKIFTRGESGFYFVFGFSSPNGITDPGFVYTNKPLLPDYVELNSCDINSDTAAVYGAFLGYFYAPHTAWGTVALKGKWQTAGNSFIGIFSYKDSTYQQDRRPHMVIDGEFDFGTLGSSLYINALDAVTTRAYDATLKGVLSGKLRYSGKSVNLLTAIDCAVDGITNDDNTVAPAGFYSYSNCVFRGGVFSSGFKNHLLNSCVFTGSYSDFPLAADISLNGCVRTGSGITGLPADLRNNIVAPFNV